MLEEKETNNNEVETTDLKSNDTAVLRPEVTEPSKQVLPESNNRLMNIMIGVVGILVVMAGIQVFQTQKLMAAVANGNLKVGAPAQESQNLGVQSQVGGCG